MVGPSVSTPDSASAGLIRPSSRASTAAGTAATASGRPRGRAMAKPSTVNSSPTPMTVARTGDISLRRADAATGSPPRHCR